MVRGLIVVLFVVTLFCGLSRALAGPDIVLEWDPNSEPDLAGYKVHWKVGSNSGPPYDGNPAIIGQPNLLPSPVRLNLADLDGITPESGVTKPQYVFEDLPDTLPGQFFYCVVTAFDNEDWFDTSSGITIHGRESNYSNEVKWQVVDGVGVVVWPPSILNIKQ
jgi:hypothetical protein